MRRTMRRVAAVAVVATVGLGAAVASAGAEGFDLTGGEFSGQAVNTQSFTIAGLYTSFCEANAYGDTEGVTGVPGALAFSPELYWCSFAGFGGSISTWGNWEFEVTSKIASSPPTYAGELRIPSGTYTTVSLPAVGCDWTVAGSQTFAHGSGGNSVYAVQNGADLEVHVQLAGVAYTVGPGCWFPSASDMTYDSNGPIVLEDVAVDEL